MCVGPRCHRCRCRRTCRPEVSTLLTLRIFQLAGARERQAPEIASARERQAPKSGSASELPILSTELRRSAEGGGTTVTSFFSPGATRSQSSGWGAGFDTSPTEKTRSKLRGHQHHDRSASSPALRQRTDLAAQARQTPGERLAVEALASFVKEADERNTGAAIARRLEHCAAAGRQGAGFFRQGGG